MFLLKSCLHLFIKQNVMDALTQLKKEKKELEARLKLVSNAIIALEPVPIKYMQWGNKAIDCTRKKAHYIQTSEILTCVVGEDIEENKDLRKRYITALSVALNYLCKDGDLKKFKVRKLKGDFYGLPEWFNEDGSLKNEYLGERLTVTNVVKRLETVKAA